MTAIDDLPAELERLSASREFRAYQRAREEVLRFRALDRERRGGTAAPSDYWEEELAGFEYLFDASPLLIKRLRHHSYHVTGLKVYEYRTHQDNRRAQLKAKLDALIEVAGGRELLVPEPEVLGGFGHEIDGQLYNLDTLKYFEVMIALEKGAVLDELRKTDERKTVWEIGTGWGGLAYVFKTLFPDVKYVLTDLPELFLFSATYLASAFPDAKLHFFDPDHPDGPLGPPDADFVFVPNTFLDQTRPPRLDLAMNTVSFQEMTADQVAGYVRHAHELGAPYLYSLNRDRSPYNPQMTSVRDLISPYYWPQETTVLPGIQYTQMLPKLPAGGVRALLAQAASRTLGKPGKEEFGYRHVVGWRRVDK
ncbi:putative sugar O-methyltransferase [Solirubrobacter soli]|uniref:putative sugar O-methyltransferase n=1 Tax=Solirubrobacter soli TaxID=363832 RepID=UPI00146AF8EE|nr:putative sugar O-methyltransferase [Solirubrobacter soli]